MISVSHLTKYYGDVLAVDDLSFEISEGHVYGFLGPNGAGKSTTMNMMTGCLSATDGSITIAGHDIFDEPEAARRCVGYLPEQPPLYMNETPVDYLRFIGEAKGLRGEALREQINTVLEKTGTTHVKHKRISTLSKGYKQRVGIAQALLGNPQIIILDEPTVGLDPLQIVEIRDLIKSLGESHTVIFSSHILSEVQAICDRILIINKGKLVVFDETKNLDRHLHAHAEIQLVTEASQAAVSQLLESLPNVTEISFEEKEFLNVRVCTDSDDVYGISRAIFLAFAQSGNILMELSTKKANLEDIFLELTEELPAEADTAAEAQAVPQTEKEAEK